MKNLAGLFGLLMVASPMAWGKTIPSGNAFVSTDFSYTSARDLWKGNGQEAIFSDNNADTRVRGKTTSYNYGLSASFGIPFGMQLDFRTQYTTTRMNNATHPNAANGAMGASVRGISEASLILKKHVYANSWLDQDFYIGYRHPGETTPQSPTFIAITDFSNHYILGSETGFHFSKQWSFVNDIRYIMRSEADKLATMELPSDQMEWSGRLSWQYDSKLTLSSSAIWRHTFSGPDISTADFVTAVGLAGHPPFYAARERFLGYAMGGNYRVGSRSYLGVSRFKKVWGRNTDRSRTWSVFYGYYF